MKILLGALVLGCFYTSAASAQMVDQGVIDPPVITAKTAVFTKADLKPGKQDFYPDRALNEELSGAATLACQFGGDGDLTECVVLNEDPKGYGFGKAGALSALYHSQPQPFADGRKAGDWVRFDSYWSLH